ncbi:MAG: hypothetical protein HN826_15800 [Methylococcales bacterium]|jgi:penicillin-binding protein 1A|nr:hypothetical protein [Methylococcales bacterium]
MIRLKLILKSSGLFLLLLTISIITSYYWLIIANPGEHLTKENILKSIAQESPVFYSDGTTQIGVFFNQHHRKYLKVFSQVDELYKTKNDYIPQQFLLSLIASEDKSFYQHLGFDPKGILRAMIANIKAGRVVQGGSTLTQQTAKNIFQRKNRSLKEKLRELGNALKLEYHYTKNEILEFYCNQFYVNGNGLGVGVAAKYYFNKQVKDLTLLETAFIVGSVKGPAKYNPFIKRNPKSKQLAINNGIKRTRYVLSRMLKQNFISRQTFDITQKQRIVFNRGKFQFTNNVVMDTVRNRLESGFFKELLSQHGIENLATSGIKIVTSLDQQIQQGALSALKSHLSYLQTVLHGYQVDKKLATQFQYQTQLVKDQFYVGKIKNIQSTKPYSMQIDFGGIKAEIDEKSIKKLAQFQHYYRQGKYSYKLTDNEVQQLLQSFNIDDYIFTKIHRVAHDGQLANASIQQIPTINGATMVLDKAQVKAMIGGFSNHHFNRAITAKREPGSVFKPITYLAALTLKWNSLDALLNTRNVFVFQNQFYFPRPDHKNAANEVSMTMAGIKSENVASIYLLYHLLDHLTKEQFSQIVNLVGLARTNNETYRDYMLRIRDKEGIVAHKTQLKRGLFDLAKKQILTELKFLKEDQQIFNLKQLNYGVNFDKYAKKLKHKILLGNLSPQQLTDLSQKKALVDNHFIKLVEKNNRLKKQLNLIHQYLQVPPQQDDETLNKALENFYVQRSMITNHSIKIQYFENEIDSELWLTLKNPDHQSLLNRLQTNKKLIDYLNIENILVENKLSSYFIDEIEQSIQQQSQQNKNLPYSSESLSIHKDFRTLVAMKYAVTIAKQLGIKSNLKNVLSFPLGTNSVTLAEVTEAYQTLLQGQTFHWAANKNVKNNFSIIDKIIDAQGNLLYQLEIQPNSLFDQTMATQISTILRGVVQYGTGRRANRKVTIKPDSKNNKIAYKYPVSGKTGTTNRYTNATFVGYLPKNNSQQSQLQLGNAYTIATYVGRDDNQPMIQTNGKIKIAGSSGALPIWIGTANSIIKSQKFHQNLDFIEMAFNLNNQIPISPPDKLISVKISKYNGLPLLSDGLPNKKNNYWTSYVLGNKNNQTLELLRQFKPIKNDEKNLK